MTRKIIVKYGELWLKSNQIRIIFAKKLVRNIKSMLNRENIEFEFLRERDRILIMTEQIDEALFVLKKVFGISQLVVSEEVDNDFEDIREKVMELVEDIDKNETFAIRASRKNKKFPMKSKELEKKLADDIDRKVNLKNPDVTIFISIRARTADIYTNKIKAAGGLPISASGRMLCLLSTGIDSPVAAWMMMKRGVMIDFITFYDGGKSETTKSLINALKEWSPRDMRLFSVEYGKARELFRRKALKYTCVFCKRYMYKIAQEIAKENGYQALVTGENLSQVASQTIYNLTTQQRDLKMPVLRPLLAMDKSDIMKIAEEIGTFKVSEKGKVKCPYVPESPATKSDDDDIFHIEQRFDPKEVVKNAVESCEMEML